ncbi:hypothetical protein PM082_002010 [Marasmius tenuissimus]|nr:hypothetical protein PM082_002010 [Marasmius tenuissimus]
MEAAKPVRPEPMNVTTHHAKVRVSLSLSDPLFVAGDAITGKMEMDCRADKGLGIGVMMVELFAIQELTSRDHHATSTFTHSRRVFQGPGYTPSNAVQPHPLPGDPQLPPGYYTARKGHSTFLFKLPVPKTSPSSIAFGDGIATVRYEVRASVGVFWKGERRMLLEKKDVDVVEAFDEDQFNQEGRGDPQAVVVAENGKIWVQARLVGGLVVAGESACVELQVKNHSTKKNSSLQIGLSRQLVLPNLPAGESPPNALQITDTLIIVPFKGPEYVIPSGVEGVASLVFDVPKSARGVRGGMYLGDAEFDRTPGKRKETRALFEVQCILGVKLVMGLGSKDIVVDIPIPVVHPASLPTLPPPPGVPYDYDYGYNHPHHHNQSPYEPYATPPLSHTPQPHPHYAPQPPMSPQPNLYYNNGHPMPMSPAPPMSPPPATYSIDPNTGLVWLPPPGTLPDLGGYYPHHSPYGYPHDPHHQQQPYHLAMSPAPQVPWSTPPRPSSAGPGGGRESARPLPIPMVAATPTPPPLPGLPPSSVRDVRQVSSAGAVSPPQSKRGRKKSAHDLGLGLGVSPTASASVESSPKAANYPGELAESGSGFRASRIANHLRVTATAKGRGRSASPVGGMRYRPEDAQDLQPEQQAQPYAVATIHGNMSKGLHIPMPPPAQFEPNGSAGAALSPPLHSPRPMLSPKQSFTKDTVNGGVSVKSERVEVLERMADAVGKSATDLSGDLPKEREKEVDINKILPKPQPQPQSPLLSPAALAKEGGDYFGNATTAPVPATPTKKFGNKSLGFGLGLGRRESGLDALEKKLLAEVGTRKVEPERRPDVWSVLGVESVKGKEKESEPPKKSGGISPIAIPTPRQGPVDPLNDSAISSLTLPDCEVGGGGGVGVGGGDLEKELMELENAREREKQEERERKRHKRKVRRGETGSEDSDTKTSVGGKSLSGRTERQKRKDKERSKITEGDGDGLSEGVEKKERRSGHTKRKGKSNARVAAWLGDMRADVPTPPAEDVIPHTPSPVPAEFPQEDTAPKAREASPLRPAEQAPSDLPPSNPSRLPDPRSSGFVPIGTLKPDIYQRTLVPKDSPFASSESMEDDARRITELWSQDNKDNKKGSPASPQVTQNTNPWKSVRSPIFAKRANGLPMFPPLREADSEVKYDIRSARGGKGGQVTTVAAIWASVTDPSKQEEPSTSKPPRPKTEPAPSKPPPKSAAGLTSSRPKSINDLLSPKATKPSPLSAASSTSSSSSRSGAAPRPSAGVPRRFGIGKGGLKATPAVVSSSHATPTLSSTASLAKPGLAGQRKQSLPLPARVTHTISELPKDAPGKRLSMPVPSKPNGIVAGEAVNNLKAIAEGGVSTKSPDSPVPKPSETGYAFGQARLKELIKKYQGQTSS